MYSKNKGWTSTKVSIPVYLQVEDTNGKSGHGNNVVRNVAAEKREMCAFENWQRNIVTEE